MYVHTPRVYLNLSTVAHATRAGNVVRLILNLPGSATVEVNHVEDAEAIWSALKLWGTTSVTMPAAPAAKKGK